MALIVIVVCHDLIVYTWNEILVIVPVKKGGGGDVFFVRTRKTQERHTRVHTSIDMKRKGRERERVNKGNLFPGAV